VFWRRELQETACLGNGDGDIGRMDIFGKLRDMRILLVDDDEWIRDSMTIYFENEGCELQAVETAEEALSALESQYYDIIIADYKLPDMDGIQFFKRIQDRFSNAIRILISAFGNDDLISEAQRIGVEDYIDKPFGTSAIVESLTRLIGEKETTGLG
jgi:DNA-binding NtrC family response regulator